MADGTHDLPIPTTSKSHGKEFEISQGKLTLIKEIFSLFFHSTEAICQSTLKKLKKLKRLKMAYDIYPIKVVRLLLAHQEQKKELDALLEKTIIQTINI